MHCSIQRRQLYDFRILNFLKNVFTHLTVSQDISLNMMPEILLSN